MVLIAPNWEKNLNWYNKEGLVCQLGGLPLYNINVTRNITNVISYFTAQNNCGVVGI